jgi:hypothetical protein
VNSFIVEHGRGRSRKGEADFLFGKIFDKFNALRFSTLQLFLPYPLHLQGISGHAAELSRYQPPLDLNSNFRVTRFRASLNHAWNQESPE